jgi:glycosyltransferase involved in cell wall biosynthesis
MAAGTCVLASDRASLPECLGEAAVFADPLDVEALAESLMRLLQDSDLRAEYEQKGLQRVKRYSWQKSAEKTLGIYREIGRNGSA